MRVALYARESPTDKDGEERVDVQFGHMEPWARSQGWEIVGHYADTDTSGDVLVDQREDGARLLRDAARGQFDMVCVRFFDRLGRGFPLLLAQHQLKPHGTLLRSQTESFHPETADGEMMLTVTAGFGGAEKRRTNMRTRGGLEHWTRRGRYVGGIVPFGYTVIEQCFTVDDDPIPGCPEWSESRVARQIFAWFLDEGVSCAKIAERLTLLGIPTPTANDGPGKNRKNWKSTHGFWHPETVRSILTNPIYMGVRYWGKTTRVAHPDRPNAKKHVPAKREAWIEQSLPHLAIVTPEEFARVPELLAANRTFSPRNRVHTYLLSGIMRCERCGFTFIGTVKGRTKRGPSGYYVCHGRHKPATCFGPGSAACPTRSIRIDMIEAHVWQIVLSHLAHVDDTLLLLRDQQDEQQREFYNLLELRDGMRRAVDRKEQERQRTVDLVVSGTLTEQEGKDKLERLREEETTLKAKLAEFDETAEALERREAKLKETGDYLREWKLRLALPFTPEEKREAVQKFVEVIRISEENGETVVRVRLRFDRDEHGNRVPTARTTLNHRRDSCSPPEPTTLNLT